MDDETGFALRHGRRADWVWIGLLALVYWLPTLWVGVRGDFPLNDDWAYARGVEAFLETGRVMRPDWVWAPAIPNVLLGAAAQAVLGASYESLRWSTLIAGQLGVIAAFWLGRALGCSAAVAGTLALALACNPVFLNLRFTFMTDVLFTTLVLLALLGVGRGVAQWQRPGGRGKAAGAWLALGFAMAALASVSRNAGPAVALAAVFLLLLPRLRSVRAAAWALALALPPIGVAGWWLVSHRGMVGALPQLGWVTHERIFSVHAPLRLAESLLTALPMLGAVVAPILPLVLPARGLRTRAAIAAVLTALAFALAWRLGLAPPFGVNIVWDFGLGARTLGGRAFLPSFPALTAALTAAGCFCASLAIVHVASGLRRADFFPDPGDPGAPLRRLCLLFLLVYTIPLAFMTPFFDRWMLPVLVPFGLVLATTGRPPAIAAARGTAAAVALLVLAGLGTFGTHDMMARQRARWDLLSGLVERGVPPGRIDGGFEFNGLTKYDPALPRERGQEAWRGDGTYRVSHAPGLEGYERVAARTYLRWMPPGTAAVSLHRRLEAPGPASDRAQPRALPRAGMDAR